MTWKRIESYKVGRFPPQARISTRKVNLRSIRSYIKTELLISQDKRIRKICLNKLMHLIQWLLKLQISRKQEGKRCILSSHYIHRKLEYAMKKNIDAWHYNRKDARRKIKKKESLRLVSLRRKRRGFLSISKTCSRACRQGPELVVNHPVLPRSISHTWAASTKT